MQTSYSCFELLEAMAKTGNPNSVSDAGVGALSVCAAIRGAYLNVKINAAGLTNEAIKMEYLEKSKIVAEKAIFAEQEILKIVESIIK
jgi:glutamate formiminotransferase/formiminotetrahydrofolate cyclodeaminase